MYDIRRKTMLFGLQFSFGVMMVVTMKGTGTFPVSQQNLGLALQGTQLCLGARLYSTTRSSMVRLRALPVRFKSPNCWGVTLFNSPLCQLLLLENPTNNT